MNKSVPWPAVCVPVSVTHVEWYEEDKRFAVGFVDGMLYLCGLEEYSPTVVVEAHQVSIGIHCRTDVGPSSIHIVR